jgi:hypothetical protein
VTSADELARVRAEAAKDKQTGEQPLVTLTDDALRRLQDAVRDESLRRADDARLCPICVAADLDTIFSCGHRACGIQMACYVFICMCVCVCVCMSGGSRLCVCILCVCAYRVVVRSVWPRIWTPSSLAAIAHVVIILPFHVYLCVFVCMCGCSPLCVYILCVCLRSVWPRIWTLSPLVAIARTINTAYLCVCLSVCCVSLSYSLYVTVCMSFCLCGRRSGHHFLLRPSRVR